MLQCVKLSQAPLIMDMMMIRWQTLLDVLVQSLRLLVSGGMLQYIISQLYEQRYINLLNV